MAKSPKPPTIIKDTMQKGNEAPKIPDVVDRAAKRITAYYMANSHNIKDAVDDLKFLNLDQWDDEEVRRRKKVGRPALTVDLLNKYVDQVCGDMRMNRSRIKVLPDDFNADQQIALKRQGIIWNIEKESNASQIYDYGGQCVTECGHGAWWVLTRYTEDNPFEQEIYIQRLRNPLVVGMDPDAKDFMKADAMWGFILEGIDKEVYKTRWPKAKEPDGVFKGLEGIGYELSWSENSIIVCHYFEVEVTQQEFWLMEDGEIITKADGEARVANAQAAALENPDANILIPEAKKKNTVDCKSIKHYILSAVDKLEGPNDIPGKFIPIVKIEGRVRNIEGKEYVRGLVRNGKDSQRLFNFWTTDAAEIVDMIPRAPWQATKDQIKGYEKDYLTANVNNMAVMLYNHVDGVPIPQRNPMTQIPTAVFQQIGLAKEGVADSLGMYRPDVGDLGPERTGAAVLAKQTPGDVSTFVFIDNQRAGILHTGRIVNAMLDEIVDTERDVRIINPDETMGVVKVNTTASRALDALNAKPDLYANGMDKKSVQKIAKKEPHKPYNKLSQGRYRVEIDTGPGFTTQRQEAAARLERVITADPSLMKVIGDLVFSMQDFIGADIIAERLKKTIPEYLTTPTVEGQSAPKPEPDPETLVKMERLKVQQMSLEVKKANLEVAKMKFLNEMQGAKENIREMVIEVMKEAMIPQGQ